MSEDLQELHLQLKDILSFIIRICRDHDIPFYMAWGSCLGAVRHHGFIPWDDDIDLYVPYAHYEKFKQACLQEQGDTYFYQDLHTDPQYFLNFAKVRKNHTTSMSEAEKHIDMHWGIGVDIFPLFAYDRPQLRRRDRFSLMLMKKIAFLPYFNAKRQGMLQKLLGIFYQAVGEEWRDRHFKDAFSHVEREGEYLMDAENYASYPLILKKEVYGQGLVLSFEDLAVRVPEDYDQYLTMAYDSNYMQIPKKGSRDFYSHEGVIIDCQKGYECYR